MSSSLPADVLEALATLDGPILSVTPIEGGLRNRTFRVRTGDGSVLVVRLPRAAAAQIDRGVELSNAMAAAMAGVAPTVDPRTSESGLLVTDFVDASALLPADLGDPHTLTRVARQLRRLHRTAAFVGQFDLAASRRSYVVEAAETWVQLPEWYGDLVPTVEAMEAALLAEEPWVASHNDLVPANILDDGSRCWLIDFEYSAPNVASFDLGTLIAAGGLDLEAADHLVSTYWRKRSAKRTAQARAWSYVQRFSYLPWARLQLADVRRDDPSQWADGGPAGLGDLHSALTGSRCGDLRADLLATQ